MNARETHAMLRSPGGWGEVGDHELTRYSKPYKRSGRKPRCLQGDNCPNRVTHTGCTNGVALMTGCEFHVAQWVRRHTPKDTQ